MLVMAGSPVPRKEPSTGQVPFGGGGRLVAKSCPTLATPWTVAPEAPLAMGFPRQEYWSELTFPSSGDLPDPGIEPVSLASPALAGKFFITVPPGKPLIHNIR